VRNHNITVHDAFSVIVQPDVPADKDFHDTH